MHRLLHYMMNCLTLMAKDLKLLLMMNTFGYCKKQKYHSLTIKGKGKYGL